MGIRVNVSEQEKQAGDREPLPIGKYHFAITGVELTESGSDNNFGKPMLAFEFTVQDTPGPWQEFANRKDFTNACLWGADEEAGTKGALYTIIMILKAIGKYEECLDGKELDIPTEPEFYLGEQLMGRRAVDKKQKDKWPDLEERWVQLRGFSPYDEATAHKTGPGAGSHTRSTPKESSLLPG
jgi:hypothetical protein